MKKLFNFIVSTIVMVNTIVGANISAKAEAEVYGYEVIETDSVAEVVRVLKEEQRFTSVVYKGENLNIVYVWDISSKDLYDEWAKALSQEDKEKFTSKLMKHGWTLDDYINYQTSWHVVSKALCDPFDTILMTM